MPNPNHDERGRFAPSPGGAAMNDAIRQKSGITTKAKSVKFSPYKGGLSADIGGTLELLVFRDRMEIQGDNLQFSLRRNFSGVIDAWERNVHIVKDRHTVHFGFDDGSHVTIAGSDYNGNDNNTVISSDTYDALCNVI